MSIKIHNKIILKLNQKEYDLILYMREHKIALEVFCPGSLVFHWNNINKIRKHELHLYGAGNPAEGTSED